MLSCALVYFSLFFSFRNHAIHLLLHYSWIAICIYVVRRMSHFVFKTDCRWKETIHFCLSFTVITRALITPNHWHPGSGKRQQKRQRTDMVLLLWQILRISKPQYFVSWLLFSSLTVKKTNNNIQRKTNNKHAHSQDCWMFTIISFAVWRWEHVYEHDRASQDYVPASQVG